VQSMRRASYMKVLVKLKVDEDAGGAINVPSTIYKVQKETIPLPIHYPGEGLNV